MAAGVEVKELAIQGVREPGERMPVGLLRRRKCPADRFRSESGANVGILGYITVIIVIYEWMLVYGVVKCQSGDREQQAKHRAALARGSK